MIRFLLVNNVGELDDHEQLFYFYDNNDNICGFLPDLSWTAWMDGRVPLTLGEHEIDHDIPEDWHQIINGKKEAAISAHARLEVSAAVVSFVGQASQHSLIDSSSNSVHKIFGNATFDTSRSAYPVTSHYTEEDLQTFLESRPATVGLTVGRNKVPRIVVGAINWPPSERVMRKLREIEHKYEFGEISDPTPLLASLYRGDLRTMFEPIWPDHPMLRNRATDTQN